MVHKVYQEEREMKAQIEQFSREYAAKGEFRESVKDMKMNFFRSTYDKLIQNPMSLQAIRRVA